MVHRASDVAGQDENVSIFTVKCNAPSVLKYDSASECCKTVSETSCGVVQVTPTTRRVVGGKISSAGEWPWIVSETILVWDI